MQIKMSKTRNYCCSLNFSLKSIEHLRLLGVPTELEAVVHRDNETGLVPDDDSRFLDVAPVVFPDDGGEAVCSVVIGPSGRACCKLTD